MFVVFEGLDGAGKSTLMKGLFLKLKELKKAYISTQDPGGTGVGDKIRAVLLADKVLAPSPETELLLYQASRTELMDKVIKPALNDSKWVISDRFYQSTIAFQGHARGFSMDVINWLNAFASQNKAPDFVIWVDTPVEECQRRLQKRVNEGEELDRLDSEKIDFHMKVREGYLAQSKNPEKNTKWIVLDGTKSIEDMTKDMFKGLGL